MRAGRRELVLFDIGCAYPIPFGSQSLYEVGGDESTGSANQRFLHELHSVKNVCERWQTGGT